MSQTQTNISVIGAGAWGTAVARVLAQNLNQQTVLLYCRNPQQVQNLEANRENQEYLPGIKIPCNVSITHDLQAAVKHSRDLILATPSKAFAEQLQQLQPYIQKNQRLAWITKGLDAQSGQFLHELVQAQLGKQISMAVISGPSFAMEVAQGQPTALTVASNDSEFAQQLAQQLHNDALRVYTSDDMLGVQLGGIMKNVLAIATGIADGLGFGANTRAALMTRGMAELLRLGEALGARRETLIGLTGLGDMILSCTDNQSRNRRMGLALAEGLSVQQALDKIKHAVEGVDNVDLLLNMAQQNKIELPITEQVHAVIHNECTPIQAVQKLLKRQRKAEH